MYRLWKVMCMEREHVQTHLDASLLPQMPTNPLLPMSLPVPSIADIPALVPTVLDDVGPEKDPPKIGSMTYNWEQNGFNLEWESRDDFSNWLRLEQKEMGIKLQVSKVRKSQAWELCYSSNETFSCTCNETGGKKVYVKKTTCERKIDSKQIKGECPCFVQIKTYPDTETILGKYNRNHSHPTGVDNLKYIWIQLNMHKLIESWVHYGVTDQEIVSDPLIYHN